MMHDYINEIIKENIHIDNQELILDYINRYGYFRIINCYGNLVRTIKKDINISTNEIIDIFNIDQLLANTLNTYLLDFEKQLNNQVINIIFKAHHLNDDYILEIIKNPAHSNLRNKGFATFIKDIYDNAKQCNLINTLALDIKEVPLKILSVSWTFNTLINFIYLQDESTKKLISNYYGFLDDYESFISICHTIRKLRNTISHNGIFINFRINHYQQAFNEWLNYFLSRDYLIDSDINLIKAIEMLSILLKQDLGLILKEIIQQYACLSSINEILINY